jgi:hypothetical protein
VKKVSASHGVRTRLDSFDAWSHLEQFVMQNLAADDAARYADAIEDRHRRGVPLVDLS